EILLTRRHVHAPSSRSRRSRPSLRKNRPDDESQIRARQRASLLQYRAFLKAKQTKANDPQLRTGPLRPELFSPCHTAGCGRSGSGLGQGRHRLVARVSLSIVELTRSLISSL